VGGAAGVEGLGGTRVVGGEGWSNTVLQVIPVHVLKTPCILNTMY